MQESHIDRPDDDFVEDICIIKISSETYKKFSRLDSFLAEQVEGISRTFIKNLFKKGLIEFEPDMNENYTHKLSLSKIPAVPGKILIHIPPPIKSTTAAENIPIEILYEDEHLIFVNKPPGLVTHPAPGHPSGTLVNALLYHCPFIQGIGGVQRPGIVHRLDKGTSGVMVVAKNSQCHEKLVMTFAAHDLVRKYEAIIIGHPKQSLQKLESLIGRDPKHRQKMSARPKTGKKAITHFRLIKSYKNLSHIELTLETGRTHQIRVHLSSLLNNPILMDPLYGRPHQHLKKVSKEIEELIKDYPHPFLHAKTLELIHPITHEKMSFNIPSPPLFQEVINLLEKDDETES